MNKSTRRALRHLPLAIAVAAALQVAPALAQAHQPTKPSDQSQTSDNQNKNKNKNQDQDQKSSDQKNQQNQSEQPTKLQGITVTGSLLQRPEYQTTSPVQVIDIESDLAAGQFGIADFVQTTAAAAGSTQINNQFGGFIVQGGTGIQSVSLRGLGAKRTLVLLDGQRPGPAGVRGQVGAFDLNVIPRAIIGRIEIVKDGASSIYGSDAVAGVVNLITRKRLDDTIVNISIASPQHGGGDQLSASIASGWNFGSGNVTVAAQFDRQQPIRIGQRDFLSCAQDRVRGKNGQRIDREDHSILQGTSLAGCNNLYANTIINYFDSSIRYVPSPDGSTVGPFPGYHPRPFPGKTYDNAAVASYEDVLNYPFYGQAYARNRVQRETLYIAPSFTFGTVNWNTKLLYNHRTTDAHGWRQFFPIVYNPDDGNYYEPIMPFPSITHVAVDYFYGTSKLSGLFTWTDSWSWEVNVGYSRSDGDYGGLRISAERSGDLGDPNNERDTPPINYFAPGILSGKRMDDLVDAVGVHRQGNTIYKQENINAVFTGNLFELPAGPVSSAFGGSYRHYSIDDKPPKGSWGYTTAKRTKGSDHVVEVFTEIGIPILQGLPGVESLTADISARAFKYATVGETDNVWKYGLNWQITPTWRIRGTIGTSYRAPGLYELYLGDQTGFLSQLSIDPCINWGESTNDFIRTNCAAAGIPSTYGGAGSSATVLVSGGLGNLVPETSRAKSLGIVWTPTFANLNVALDYFDYHIQGEITNLGASEIIFGCYGSPVYPNNFCDFFDRNPPDAAANANSITQVHSTYININSERTRGYDLQINFSDDFSFGRLSADAQVTYTLEDSQQLFDTAAESGFTSTDFVGFIGRPKTVGIANMSLERGDWTYNWQGTYVSSTSNKNLDEIFTYFGYEGARRDITASWQFRQDVSVTYHPDDWGVTLGIRNVFDRKPDLISSGVDGRVGNTPLYASQYDWFGRTYFVRVNFRM